MDDGSQLPFWLVAIFWAAELIVIWLLMYSLFCRKVFTVDYDSLYMNVSVLGLRWSDNMQISQVIELRQIQDGGQGKDSFPSWGLNIIGEIDEDIKTIKLISRQPHSRSIWLGSVLASRLGVPFIKG